MKRVLNFNPGPAVLPEEVLKIAAENFQNYRGKGVSLSSLSHRSIEIREIVEEASRLVRDLYQLPESFEVLWLPGGASSQLNLIPLNFCSSNSKVGFFHTGFWANKAMESFAFHTQIQDMGSSAATNYDRIPDLKPQDELPDFLYLISNETIDGLQWREIPDLGMPLFVDMTSDLFTRDYPWDRIAVGFASAQKNFGIAGITCVLVNRKLLPQESPRPIPPIWNYRVHQSEASLYHTLPTFPMYVAYLMLEWIAKEGGISAMDQRAKNRSALVYEEINRNPFLESWVNTPDQSLVNACFRTSEPTHEKKLVDYLSTNQVIGIQGFPTKGGFRASMYNGMPLEDVEDFVGLLKSFEV